MSVDTSPTPAAKVCAVLGLGLFKVESQAVGEVSSARLGADTAEPKGKGPPKKKARRRR